jgi:hypothetical protein
MKESLFLLQIWTLLTVFVDVDVSGFSNAIRTNKFVYENVCIKRQMVKFYKLLCLQLSSSGILLLFHVSSSLSHSHSNSSNQAKKE